MTNDILDIVQGCKNHSRLMQKGLYQLCYKEMMKVCLRYSNDLETAGSLYNDAMIKIFDSISKYHEDGKLMAWVKRIVVNTCIDHVRKKLLPPMKELNEELDGSVIIENEVFIKMSAADIRKFINRLPGNAALVFNLYVYDEYSHKEISNLLKIPVGTSRYYLSEARRLLKELVSSNSISLNKM